MGTTELFDRILYLGKWDEYVNYAMFAWLNQRISMFNSALAFLQRPGVAWLLTEAEWESHGRSIRPDATPIVLMKPFGPVYFYYDFADTEGRYVPRDIKWLNEFHFPKPQPVADKFLPILKEACRYMSISYYEKAFGTKQLGEAGPREKPDIYTVSYDEEKTHQANYYITVSSTTNDTGRVHTLLHELGHILCGHIKSDLRKEGQNYQVCKPPYRGKDLNLAIRETEAEKVCETVCRMINVTYNPDDYLEQYGGAKEDGYTARCVIEASDKILQAIKKVPGGNILLMSTLIN
ncbi:protein of unknown function [Oribacterium sp. KHPX15]|uniref:ImmA/IrrE family metallo-endopeptidase n=1 Tax=Oribacterium sp. KHPX15 TaxID=1855342 RepID=UPI000895B13F|nr:ImmA/IrrE family metallo-endopeptidase [Oribacterium sp. KHPX15]SEA97598.1 protein of unknown function [Oribacterium sp. KHPX15]